jgi:YegS/Rv2252/BmrU family lipid kinase
MDSGEVSRDGRMLVVVNPISGSRRSGRVECLIRELAAGPWKVEVVRTERAGDARQAAASAGEGTALAVAVGGDGTLNEVISGLGSRGIPVGVVPLGTANLLAREFHIPLDIKGACSLVLRGRWRGVDLGRTDRGVFLSVAGAGFDAAVVHRFASRRSGNARFSSYFQPILETVSAYPFPRIAVELDGALLTHEATGVVVANTRNYGGPFIMARDARPDDGLLDVCVFDSANAGVYTAHMAAVLLQNPDLLPGADFLRARCVTCRSEGEVPVQLDGDPRGYLPITFEVVPGAVKLISP